MTTLDLDQGVLVLQLDMSLDADVTIDCTQIGINSVSGDSDNVYPLSSLAAIHVAESDEVSCVLGVDLVITIQTDSNFRPAISNTYVYIDSGTGIIAGGAELPPDMGGRMVDNVLADMTPPELLSFDLDLTQDVLILTFSEPVDTATFNSSAAVIQSASSNPVASLTLTMQSMPQSSIVAMVVVVELNEDANLLKALSLLATSSVNTYLSISLLVMDINGNHIVPIFQSNAIAVSAYTPDTIVPEVVSFDLDLNTVVLTLVFSEPVQASSFVPSKTVIQSSPSGSLLYPLSEQSTAQGGNAVILTISLGIEDSNGLKLMDNLATSGNDTFLSCSEGLVADTNGNPSAPIDSSTALQVNTYTPDTSGPIVILFDLDLDGNVLALKFSEPVRIDSFTPSEIVLLSSLDVSAASVQLSEQSVPQASNPDTVVIHLNRDAQNLKINTLLATSSLNTFLSFTENMVTDTSGNSVVPIPSSSALMASNYTEDTTRPMLQSFILDLDSNQLVFNFTEPVLVNMINSSALILSNHPEAPTVQITEIEIVVLNSNSDTVNVSIVGEALCLIKANSAIGNDGTDTILSVQGGAFFDTNGNPVTDQTIPGTVVGDESSPSVASFLMDMDNGLIELTFDDAIDVDSQSVSGAVAIQRAPSDANPYILQGGIVTGGVCSMVVTIHLLQPDLNALKTTPNLAVTSSNTFIVINDTAFRDLIGNYITAVGNGQALAASIYIRDTTVPILETFDLDLNVGELILTFDEPVNVSSINITAFSLRWNQGDGSTVTYTLTGGSIISTDTDRPTIYLTLSDLSQIKCLNDVRVDANNTHLQATLGTVFDTTGNPVEETSVPAHNVTGDITPPQLITFDMDINSGTLSLTFDEPVDPSTLVLSQISLQSTATDTASRLTLTSGSTSSEVSSVVEIRLTVNDLNAIKINSELAKDPNSTYISVGAGFVEDCAGISASSISSVSALQVTLYSEDVTPPELISFNLDLDDGTLILYFDEPVDVSSLDVSGITIQNAPFSPTASLTFTTLDQAVSDSNSLMFTISLSSTDLMALQNLQTTSDIAVNSISSYLSMTSSTIMDLNDNSISAISVNSAFRVNEFSPDAPDITQSIPGAMHILLSWSIPTGPPTNNYTVTWERDTTGECSDEDEGSATLNDDLTSYILTGLEEDSDYTITVIGLNAFGGAVSDPLTISTQEAGKSHLTNYCISWCLLSTYCHLYFIHSFKLFLFGE